MRSIVEAGIFVALTFIIGHFEFRILPQGGSVNIVALPLAIYAFRNGFKLGVAAGGTYGLLRLLWMGVMYHPLSGLLDFIIPSAAMGLAGLFKGRFGAYLGIIFGGIVGLASHILSGVLIFGHFMPDIFMGIPMGNVFFYSFIYNVTHVVPSIALSLFTLSLLYKPLERFIQGGQSV